MSHFSRVTIIFNPNSTGPGRQLAEQLRDQLRKVQPDTPVDLTPTKSPGHAQELAYAAAHATPHPLVIASSGDGGYHEVVNGVMAAQAEGARVVTGLLPAGNANDHYHSLHHDDIVPLIVAGRSRTIDLLALSVETPSGPLEHYAHSYIGIGLTPKVGRELNKVKLNAINQVWIAVRTLLTLRPVEIIKDGRPRSYDSLIFSNLGKMSKILSLSDHTTPSDGSFLITAFPHRSKWALWQSLVTAATTGLGGQHRATRYQFQIADALAIQLDGEILTLEAGSVATIRLEPAALHCIV